MRFPLLLFFLLIYCYSSAQNNYGLRNVTLNYKETCSESISDPNNLIYCRETQRKIDWKTCWLTVIQENGYATKGIAMQTVGPHYVWLKEITDYDPDGNVIASFYDSLTHVNLIKPKYFEKMKVYLIKKERFILRQQKDITTPVPTYKFFKSVY